MSVALLPFLAAAAFLLFVFPDRTGELFAWQIEPPLSGYMLASAYVGGIWFFVRVAFARSWHEVRHGFPAVAVFAAALLVATLLHLDRFSSNLPFAVWMTLYATTPFAVTVLAVVQHKEDPRRPDEADIRIPRWSRIALAAIGAAALLTGLALFAAPEAMAEIWAWELTPLTAQVIGAVLALTGFVDAALLWDVRWSAFRILFQAQLISLVAIAASLVLRRDDLLWSRPAAPVFVALVAVALAAYAAFTIWCDRRAADP